MQRCAKRSGAPSGGGGPLARGEDPGAEEREVDDRAQDHDDGLRHEVLDVQRNQPRHHPQGEQVVHDDQRPVARQPSAMLALRAEHPGMVERVVDDQAREISDGGRDGQLHAEAAVQRRQQDDVGPDAESAGGGEPKERAAQTGYFFVSQKMAAISSTWVISRSAWAGSKSCLAFDAVLHAALIFSPRPGCASSWLGLK